ncbi:hypothetical protein Pfo_018917 [Paulownia fortunei]|nr:hypothetical protein Pfo_018917 [Paulownia fortunei]
MMKKGATTSNNPRVVIMDTQIFAGTFSNIDTSASGHVEVTFGRKRYVKQNDRKLGGKDKAIGEGAETFEECVEVMGEEEEIEVNSAPISGPRARPSSSTDSMHDEKRT